MEEETNTSPPAKELRARCRDCANLTPLSELTWLLDLDGDKLGKEHRVCNSCVRRYEPCEHCGIEHLDSRYIGSAEVRTDRRVSIMHICERCLENDYDHCDYCDCYYNTNDYNDCPCDREDEDEEERVDNGDYRNPIRRIDVESGKLMYGTSRTSSTHIKSPRMFGIEFEMVPIGDDSSVVRNGHNLIHDNVPRFWGVTTDASLPSNSLEVQTAPMAMKLGEDTTVEFLDKINKSKLWKITDRCGTHVHIDCNDIKDKYNLIRKLMASFFVFDDVFLAMQPASRRRNRYCSPLSKERAIRNRDNGFDKGFDMEELLKMQSTNDILHTYYKTQGRALDRMMHDHYNEARYYGINFHTLFDGRGTVENRYHEGTLDAKDILLWTALNQHIVDTSRLMTDVLARELYAIKGATNRALAYAKATCMPTYLLSYVIKRLNQYK